ncbi:MAG: hypothetical protein JRJ38_10540 [Deltaproteobacteria bacterium]|nr:hypothetical protein [Deltaproteobacteria bacterium]
MGKFLRKWIFFLWPPYEAYIARKFIDTNMSGSPQQRMEWIQRDIRKSLSESIDLGKTQSLAKFVFESESKRKETIENKALAFMFAFSVCVSVISVLPALFGEKLNIPCRAATMSVSFYGLAIPHLLMAAYYAIQARRVSGFALPSADESLKAIRENRLTESEHIVMYVSQAKFNEPILTKKANCLAVAEKMFIRGLFLLAFAGSITVVTKLLVAQSVPGASSNLTAG